jgi:lysophospholipase L1-like esterase
VDATSQPPSLRGPAISLAKKLGLAAGSLLFTLGLLEVGVRLLHLGSGGFWEPYALYGWRNIPGASGWESCYGECAVHVEINRLGLRDAEIPYQPAPEEQRILFLGDSMTAAMQVPVESSFVEVLEQALNEGAEAGRWQAINAAVNGYGTDNELLFYRFEAHQYQSPYVILGIYLANDIYNNSRELELRVGGNSHKPYFELDADGALVLRNFPVPEADSLTVRMGTFLKRNFQLPRFAAQVLHLRNEVPDLLQPLVSLLGGARGVQAETTGASPGGQGDICDAVYDPEIEHAWEITRAIIRTLREEVRSHGAELAVMVIPASPQLTPPGPGEDWYCDRPNQELAGFLEAEGIPSLDLLQPFREYTLEGGPALYFRRDFHLNEAGHRLAGQLLADFVTDQWIQK